MSDRGREGSEEEEEGGFDAVQTDCKSQQVLRY